MGHKHMIRSTWVLLLVVLLLLGGCGRGSDPSSPDIDAEGAPDLDTVSTDSLGGEVADPLDDTTTPGPCIRVDPEAIVFGGQAVGDTASQPLAVISCGVEPLEITSLVLAEGSAPDFTLDLGDLIPTTEDPVVVEAGAPWSVLVHYTPDMENPVDDTGVPAADMGVVLIESSAPEVLEVPLSGIGMEILCPVAVIHSDADGDLIPTTVIHLLGADSYAAFGSVATYAWSVVQPEGSVSGFMPSAEVPTPIFEVDVVGTYTFSLTVTNEQDTPSCTPALLEVTVIPDEGIHVELLWQTPGDPDESDTGPDAGSDLDLHFVHPWAEGPDLDGDGEPDGWFDQPFDCFWFNAHPEWGSFDPEINDNPDLVRDDTDGAGPEIMILPLPEDVTYRVGVQYWNSHQLGPSWATVRVYLKGELAFEVAGVKLMQKDMWEVCTVDWPSGEVNEVLDAAGQRKITPNYENPFFFND